MYSMAQKVLDFHVHFHAKSNQFHRDIHPAIRAYQQELRMKWREKYGFPEPEKEHPGNEVMIERWVKEMEKYHLSKVVFLTGGGNDTLAQVIQKHPDKFIGFAHHDPCQDGAAEELQRAVEELGLSGFKAFGPLMTISFDDPKLKPFWRYLADKKLPTLIHFGIQGGPGGIVDHPTISPLSIARVVQEYVDIPFIFPHFGAGYWQELLHLAWSSPNVHIDTSGSNDWVRWMPYPLTLKDLFAKAFDTVGPKRVIFGSDALWFPRGFPKVYLDEQLRICDELGLSQEEKDLVFHDNAARLLGLV
jgi:hypothetical protein